MAVQQLRKMYTIYTLHPGKRFHHFTHLIALQMPDQMPAQSLGTLGTHLRNFGEGFLDTVLAKIGDTQIIRYLDKFDWPGFAHSYQGNLSRITPNLLGGMRNPSSHLRNILC